MPRKIAALLLAACALAGRPAPSPASAEPPPTAAQPAAEKQAPTPPASRPMRTEKDLPEPYRAWLEEVDVLITKAERATFIALEKDYQREAFVERFWQVRDPYPDTARNELREQWEERVAYVKQELGGLREDRARIFLLNGPPDVMIKSTCNMILWPVHVWWYPPSQRVRESFVVLFVQAWGLGRFRIWQPGEGIDELFQAPPPGASPSALLAEIASTCTQGDQIAGAISFILRQGALGYTSQISAAERPIEGPRREWVATFNAYSTEIPEDARPLPGELAVAFPSRRQSRTIAQGTIAVPAAGAGRATLGGHESFNFLLNGEILRGRKLFDSFRYRFDFPAASVGEKIPLVFERLLRPGEYTLVVRVEDLNGNRFYRSETTLSVPTVAGDVGPPPPDPETAQLLAEANAAIDTGDTTIELVRPRGEMLAGMVRFDTLTTGPDIAEVAFLLDGRTILRKTRPPYSVELDLGNVPRSRTLRAEVHDGAGAVRAADELIINASAHRFALHLVEPRRGQRYEKSLRAEAQVELPEGAVVERVEFFLDENLIATLYQEPFSQPIVLPAGGATAYVRAVAYLPDGNSTEDLVFVNAPEYLEEVDVQFVELYTTVLDRDNRPVADLAESEFAVLEDGVPQQVVRFEQLQNLPVHVGVLLDVSASMEGRIDQAKQAALRFLESTVKPKDRAAVITFNDRPALAVKFTSDFATLAGGLAGLKAERGTSLYDTVVFSLFYFNGVKGQRALLLLSDGKDENSRFPFEDALDFARRAGVAIYSIGLDLPRTEFETRRVLTKLAEETGGRAFFIKDVAELAVIYAAIEKELRSRYLLAYQSTNTSREARFRTVEVKVGRSGLEAKTLRGYYP